MVGAMMSNGAERLTWLSSFFGGTFFAADGGASKPTIEPSELFAVFFAGLAASFASGSRLAASFASGSRLALSFSSVSLISSFCLAISRSLENGCRAASWMTAGNSAMDSPKPSIVGAFSRSSKVLAGWSFGGDSESGGRISLGYRR